MRLFERFHPKSRGPASFQTTRLSTLGKHPKTDSLLHRNGCKIAVWGAHGPRIMRVLGLLQGPHRSAGARGCTVALSQGGGV
jgi:hypothetical protein